jgi:chitodextrinase
MMKKFTLLFFLLAVSFGYSQALPFNFEGTLHGFIGNATGDPDTTITNGTGNDVLQITGPAADWDRATVTFANPIDLTDNANNTLRFTIQSTTAAPLEVHQHGISFQGGGGSIEVNFITTGTDVVNVELNFETNLGVRNEMHIFTDVGDFGGQHATGGQSGMGTGGLFGTYIIDNITLGADPETCSDGIMNQDETGVDCGGVCGGVCDTTPPTAFTAVLGTVGGASVELLLNATDAESSITYDVTYDGGGTAQTTEVSGVEKSLVISGLTPETMYTFMVSASDTNGNQAANNAISVSATTTAIVALPFDFSSANQLFSAGGSTPSLTTDPAEPSNDVLQIDGGAGQWDNVSFTFDTPVDLSNDAANNISFRIKATQDYGVRNHILKFENPPIEVPFSTAAGTDWQEFSLDFGSGKGSYSTIIIITDTGSTVQGVYLIDDISAPEVAPETCSDGIMNQDETGIDCGGVCTACDVTAPTPFTATAGTIGAFSVELLLNATDESGGDITYDISYNAGVNTAQATGASGVEESFTVSGLTAETAYSFEVTASDSSGNTNVTTITVMATTTVDPSNDCAGQTADYAYTFETLPSGTDVRVTIEILNTVTGLVAQFFNDGSGNQNPTAVSGTPQKFEYTFPGLANGAVISFTAGFAWEAGGSLSVSRSYTVGDTCPALSTNDFDLASFSVYPNPTQDSWTVKTKNTNISSIKVYSILGKNVLSIAPNASEVTINGASLKAGLYFAQVKTASGISSLKLIKK